MDAVFFNDCPLCSTNLKVMWCEYACNPEKANFTTFNGYTFQGSIEYALVNFQLDTNYACDIFQSCE